MANFICQLDAIWSHLEREAQGGIFRSGWPMDTLTILTDVEIATYHQWYRPMERCL